jgi:two-component system, NarL family, invasion response regulator UvrY
VTEKRISVLCVDDNADLMLVLTMLIASEDDMKSVGSLGSADDLVAAVEKLKPDVVMLDLTMPGRPPLDALRELSATAPETRVIAFSGHDDRQTVGQAIDAGACGLVSKHSNPADIISAIRRAARPEKHP